MKHLLDDVRNFHAACDVPCLDKPTVPPRDRIDLRNRLLREEYHEYVEASYKRDIVGIADALADIIYICIGTAHEFGIPLDRVWDEVHRSNMAKVDPITRKATKRPDGKVVKPANWKAPDISGLLESAK